MKTSELIEKLEKTKERWDDLPVRISEGYGKYTPVAFVNVACMTEKGEKPNIITDKPIFITLWKEEE